MTRIEAVWKYATDAVEGCDPKWQVDPDAGNSTEVYDSEWDLLCTATSREAAELICAAMNLLEGKIGECDE